MMLEGILELVFEIFGEFLLQLLIEFITEVGVRRLFVDRWSGRRPAPIARFFAYVLLGTVLGFVTVAVLPQHLLRTDTARILNFVLTPVLIGFAMVWLGKWRSRRDQPLIGLDRFWCGWGFAFALAGVRYFCCN
jgi:hypothetical protein